MTVEARRIILNTVAGSGAKFLGIGISFLTTSILVNRLGEESFGLFAIVAALPAYAGLLDFGIGAGLVKHLTEYSESKNTLGVRQVVTLSVIFYLLLGLILTPVIYFLTPQIAHLLAVPPKLRHAADISILAMFLYFIGSGIVGIFTARLVSLHRMDITAAISLVGQVIYGVLVIALIPRFPTILNAVILTIVQLVVTGVAMYAVVLRTDKHLYSNPFAIPRNLIKKLFTFGGWMQLNSLTSLVNLDADKLIIANFVSLTAVTPYQIGNRIASLSRIIPFQLLSALMPAATMVHVSRTRADAENFYRDMSRYLMLLTLCITGFCVVAADRLIITWIGRPYPLATFIVFALSFSFAANNLTGGGTTMVRAAGEPQYETYYAVLSMVLNILLTIALAPKFGLVGILGGTIIANVIGSFYFIVIFHRRYKYPFLETIWSWLWRLLAVTFVSCLGVYLLQLAEPIRLSSNRITGLLLVGVNGLAYCALFVGGLKVFGFWNTNDMAIAQRIGRKLVPVRQHG